MKTRQFCKLDARLCITLKAFLRLRVRKLSESSVTDECMYVFGDPLTSKHRK